MHWFGQHAHHGPVRGPFGRPVRRRLPPLPVLIVGGVIAVGVVLTVIAVLVVLATTVAVAMAPVVLTVGAVKLARYRRHRAALAGQHPGLAHGHRAAVADPWPGARSRFALLRSEYAAYECDALEVLRLPALADVTVPSTARFIEAFAEAQALDTETPPPAEHRARYLAAVDNAWRAWQAARETAERMRLSHLSEQERTTVERVVRLLTTARDTDNDSERLVAYGKARSELAKLERTSSLRLPRPAQAALDNAYRGQLPEAEARG
ncbi:MAG TPA: hypothetical protein VGD67_01915 [Pseudonocardiaceae bacterium]